MKFGARMIGEKEEVPNILTVKLDTRKNKILKIIRQPRNSKLEPAKIYVKNWEIDSDEAVQIAKEAFKHDKDFDFTTAFIIAEDIFVNGETWDVKLIDEKNLKKYQLTIDA